MASTKKLGFSSRHRSRVKKPFGFQAGDLVRAVVLSGNKVGIQIGRVLCRKSGSFDIATSVGRVTAINQRYGKGAEGVTSGCKR